MLQGSPMEPAQRRGKGSKAYVLSWVVGSLGRWVVGSLGRWVVGSLGRWVVGSLGIALVKRPVPFMRTGPRMTITPALEIDAKRASETCYKVPACKAGK